MEDIGGLVGVHPTALPQGTSIAEPSNVASFKDLQFEIKSFGHRDGVFLSDPDDPGGTRAAAAAARAGKS